MKILGYIALLCILILLFVMGSRYSVSSEAPDAEVILDSFRTIDWDKREVGEDKDLSDSAWKIRIETENGLITLGKSAVPLLIDACNDSNKHVRLLSAYVLTCKIWKMFGIYQNCFVKNHE